MTRLNQKDLPFRKLFDVRTTDQFRAHAERARKNGKLQKAFDNHWVTPEETEALCR